MATLFELAKTGRVDELVAALNENLEAKDDESEEGLTLMHIAAQEGHCKVIEALAQLGCNLDEVCEYYAWTPIHYAALNGHVETLETLIRLGSSSLDTLGSLEESPFALAARSGHIPVLKALVRLGSKQIAYANDGGYTAFSDALICGYYEAAEFILDQDSSVINLQSEEGDRPIHMIACRKNATAQQIELLYRAGCDIDAPDCTGSTALHMLAEKNNSAALEAVIRFGSTAFETQNEDGRTPFDVACWSKFLTPLKTFLHLGYQQELMCCKLPSGRYKLVHSTLKEDESVKVRERVYFSYTLTDRLINHLCRQKTQHRPLVQFRS